MNETEQTHTRVEGKSLMFLHSLKKLFMYVCLKCPKRASVSIIDYIHACQKRESNPSIDYCEPELGESGREVSVLNP